MPRTVLLLSLLACAADVCADPTWRAVDRTAGMLATAAHGRQATKGLFGAVTAGYIATRGNAESTSVNLGATLGYVSGPWRHVAALKGIYGASADATTASAYGIAEQSDFSFGDVHYLFAAFSADRDRFGAYATRASETLGYGRNVLRSERQALDLQIGAGARQTRAHDGEHTQEGIVSVGGSYFLDISQHAEYSQQLTVERGADNTYAESNSAVKAALDEDLALSVSFISKYNSEVAPATRHTDSITLVSLIYDF